MSPTPPILIRPALLSDAPSITAIQISSWLSTYTPFFTAPILSSITSSFTPTKTIQVLQTSGLSMYVAEVAGEVVGYTGFLHTEDEEGLKELKTLYISDAWQRKGVARALVERAMEGVEGRVKVMMVEGNEGALKFYESLGFRDPVRTWDPRVEHFALILVRP